jgi:hypothetical protein
MYNVALDFTAIYERGFWSTQQGIQNGLDVELGSKVCTCAAQSSVQTHSYSPGNKLRKCEGWKKINEKYTLFMHIVLNLYCLTTPWVSRI